ncbi:hypothetical protein H4S06_004040 [Coemansia sp. BCRC 34490]|nr:hypothetical protein H4S06_004040 [Coemansia sp. BCRC 34490]
MSELVDTFYTARNLLYLGAYSQALDNLSALTHLDSDQELEKQALQYRAYIGQKKYAKVLDALPAGTSSSPPLLQALRLLAQGLADQQQNNRGGGKGAVVVEEVEKLVSALSNNTSLTDPTFAVVAAQVLANAGGSEQQEAALKMLAAHPRNLECVALTVAIFVRINRADLAQKLMARVRSWAEDSPLAQLAEAWAAINSGGDESGGSGKYADAYYIFDELAQASSVSTPLLLNARAAAKMHLAQYDEASELLQEALLLDANDPDTLANSAVCASFVGADAAAENGREKYLALLRDADPAHPFIRDLDAKSAEFDVLATKYAKVSN